jgi:MFS family permease
LFFPNSDPTTALLASFATFSIAFFARPLGAVVFGHFGDRIGRKTTLVAALLTMGVSTVVIGLLPSYDQIGVDWRRCCSRCAASARASASAANGAARCCSPPRTRPRASAAGTACSRSSARPSGCSSPPASSGCCCSSCRRRRC